MAREQLDPSLFNSPVQCLSNSCDIADEGNTEVIEKEGRVNYTAAVGPLLRVAKLD